MNAVTLCLLSYAFVGSASGMAWAQSVPPAVEPAPIATASGETKSDSRDHPSKFVVGARLGYALSIGNVMENWSLRDTIKAQVPFQLEFGYKLLPSLQVGGYAQFGYGLLGDSQRRFCDVNDSSCWAWVLQAVAQAQYHLLPSSVADPWVGLGLGLEWASTRDETNDDTRIWLGWLVDLQTGLDVRLTDKFGIGPFGSLSVGQYQRRRYTYSDGSTVAGAIADKGWHAWLTLGVRGTFNF